MKPERDARPSVLVTVLEILLLLPGCMFLGAVAARGLTGPPIQALLSPFIETVAHAPRWVFLLSLLAMPAAALCIGAAALLRAWAADASLHEDAGVALVLVLRRILVLVLLATTVLAGLILAIVVGHMLTD